MRVHHHVLIGLQPVHSTPDRPIAPVLGLIAVALLLGCLAPPSRASAQSMRPDSSIIAVENRDEFYFYKGRPYGSDAYMGPLDVLLNKGYAVAQFNNRNRYIFDYDYGSKHMVRSITQIGSNVERYGGWRKFIGDEIFPTSFTWREWKWAPNYVGHFLEGGMTFRRLSEWNRVHGVPAPAFTAGVVTMAAAVINEMYSHPGFTEGSAATAADLLFFDPLGIAVFSIDGVSEFVSGTLGGNVWASQAALTFDGELVNNGNNFVLKLPISPIPSTSVFIRSGLAFTPGITWHRSDGLDVSFALGGEGRIQNVDPDTGEETPELAIGGGIFVDRGGSLLVSVMASETEHRRFVVNVYPGVIDVAGGRLGAWMILRENWGVRVGVSIGGALGLGLAAGVR